MPAAESTNSVNAQSKWIDLQTYESRKSATEKEPQNR